jgi:hypothetical protein
MGWVRPREWDVPANGCCQERARIVIASNPDPGGRWAARCTAGRKDLDNDHAAAAARARRVMIGGGGLRIGCVVRRRWIDLRHWRGHQLLGTGDVGLAAGAGQQSVVAGCDETPSAKRGVIRISGNFWTRVSSSLDDGLIAGTDYRADEAGTQPTAQSERIKS